MLRYLFPKELNFSYKSYAFLIAIDNEMWERSTEEIEFDFSATKIIYTNHLAILIYIVQKILSRENILTAIIGKEKVDGSRLVDTLYSHYAIVKYSFIYPGIISYYKEGNPRRWLFELKLLNLAEFEKIKVIISELFANLKMHTTFREGTFAGFIDSSREYLFLSVVNYDIQIRKTIELRQKMVFENDFEALLWALKETNTTRDGDTSGGLGLYLLRKYIQELRGECIIITGNCFLRLDERCFDADHVNHIFYAEHRVLRHSYGGNIFSLKLPFKENADIVNKQNIVRVEIDLGDIYGLFS